MRSLTIRIHKINGLAAPALDLAGLRDVYRSAEVDLTFVDGSTLPSDPASEFQFSYRNLIPVCRQEDPVNGHLILGGFHPEGNLNIAGELVDLQTRGLAVIYQYCNYVTLGADSALLQTTAHEIGHLLNLGHGQVSAKFDSVMDQAAMRDQQTSAAWDIARAEATQEAAVGHPSYWRLPQPLPRCHPFALVARQQLDQMSDPRLRPWGEIYQHPYGGSHDRWFSSSALRIVPDAASFSVGGVLAFTVVFENRSAEVVAAPSELGPTFDSLILQIIRPDGTAYRHRPRGIACSTGRVAVPPGGRLSWPFCTIRGSAGRIALDQEGDYEVTAIAPALGLSSLPTLLTAEDRRPRKARDRAAAALASAPTAQLLRPAAQREVAARYRASDLDLLTRGYLALAQLHLASSSDARARFERVALSRNSPREVRHAAAIARVKRLSAEGRLSARTRRDIAAHYLNEPDDEQIAQRLREFAL